jgi:transposase
MRKLQIPDSETVRKLIHQELVRCEESRYGHRLHGLLLLTAGLSCGQVAALLGEDSTTVQRWVRRFERGGLVALRERKRSGRPRLLDEVQWHKLEGDLRMNPREFGLPAKLWSGRVLSEHLHLHYGVDLGIRQSQRIFRRLSSGRRKPVPRFDRG